MTLPPTTPPTTSYAALIAPIQDEYLAAAQTYNQSMAQDLPAVKTGYQGTSIVAEAFSQSLSEIQFDFTLNSPPRQEFFRFSSDENTLYNDLSNTAVQAATVFADQTEVQDDQMYGVGNVAADRAALARDQPPLSKDEQTVATDLNACRQDAVNVRAILGLGAIPAGDFA